MLEHDPTTDISVGTHVSVNPPTAFPAESVALITIAGDVRIVVVAAETKAVLIPEVAPPALRIEYGCLLTSSLVTAP